MYIKIPASIVITNSFESTINNFQLLTTYFLATMVKQMRYFSFFSIVMLLNSTNKMFTKKRKKTYARVINFFLLKIQIKLLRNRYRNNFPMIIAINRIFFPLNN